MTLKHAIAAAGFGFVEAAIGVCDRVQLAAVRPEHGHSCGDRDPRHALELLDLSANSLREDQASGLIRMRQHGEQLLAAPADRNVALADGIEYDSADRAQDCVSRAVTVLIVDLLEMVDVEQYESERRSIANGVRDFARERFFGLLFARKGPLNGPRGRARASVPAFLYAR